MDVDAARAEFAASEAEYRSFDRDLRPGESRAAFAAAYRAARDRHDAALQALAEHPDAPEVTVDESGAIVTSG